MKNPKKNSQKKQAAQAADQSWRQDLQPEARLTWQDQVEVMATAAAGLDKAGYLAALQAANGLITQAGDEGQASLGIPAGGDRTDRAFARWQAHQAVNRVFAEARARALGLQAVFGFFPAGVAQEVSTFGGGLEGASERFALVAPVATGDPCPGHEWARIEGLVIGYGPADFAVAVKATFDTTQDQEFGWSDGQGVHVERYSSADRVYTRRSMSGRAHYDLHIGADGVCTPFEVS